MAAAKVMVEDLVRDDRETFTLRDPEEVERAEDAVREITRLFVHVDAQRNSLLRRMDELAMNTRELRRKKARTQLDAFLPPLRLLSIEHADSAQAPPPTLRSLLGLLFTALDDVLRIWWGNHFLPAWRSRFAGGVR